MGRLDRLAGLSLITAMLAACVGTDALAPIESTSTQPSLHVRGDTTILQSHVEATRLPIGVVSSSTETPFPTPEPLTKPATTSCHVTLPNGKSPPGRSDFNHGNEGGSIFTILWPGGKVIFTPNGPGRKNPDGSLGMKWPWWRAISGEVVIGGRRLDAPAPPMPTVTLRGIPDGYSSTGFHPSELLFPSEGCWEVTGRVGDASLTFVTLVLRVPFDPPWPVRLPQGLFHVDTSVDYPPMSILYVFASTTEGEVRIETTLGAKESRYRYPDATPLFTVWRHPARCVQGARDEQGRWQAGADAGALEWAAGAFSYRISHSGLGLRCEDLLRIAGSLS